MAVKRKVGWAILAVIALLALLAFYLYNYMIGTAL
jgi:hypothetical protein